MISRIKEFPAEPEEKQPTGDYWVVSGGFGWFYVTEETAQRILRKLNRPWTRWIRLVDLAGSEVRIPARQIDSVYESTAEQRAAKRTFQRARREEDKEGRLPWEDDKW